MGLLPPNKSQTQLWFTNARISSNGLNVYDINGHFYLRVIGHETYQHENGLTDFSFFNNKAAQERKTLLSLLSTRVLAYWRYALNFSWKGEFKKFFLLPLQPCRKSSGSAHCAKSISLRRAH